MRKYLLRLLCFSLVLGTVPTVLIGLVSYSIATRDIEAKVNEGNMQLLLQTQMRVEQMLQTLEMSATQLANSSAVQLAMNSGLTSSDFARVRELTTELAHLRGPAIVKQAYLVNFGYNWAISLESLKQLSELEQLPEFTAYAAEPANMFWRTDGDGGQGAGRQLNDKDLQNKATDTVSLVMKLPMQMKTNEPKGLLVVQISAAELREGLAPASRLGSSFVLDPQGHVFVSAAPDRAAYAEISRRISSQEREDGRKQGMLRFKLNGTDAAALYRTSSPKGWTYVSVVSIEEMTRATKKIALATVAACLLILLVVAALAFVGSRRMYLPIGRLFALTQAMGTGAQRHGVRSDELDHIQASLKTLAVSRTRLQEQMEGQAAQLKEFFVLKLFCGQMTDGDFLYRSRMYGFPAGWNRLCVLVLQIDSLRGTRYQERDRELLLFAANNIVAELLPPDRRFSSILLHTSQVTLLALDAEETEPLRARVYQTAELIQSKVEQYLQLKTSIGISSAFAKPSETVRAYNESLAALRCRMSLGSNIIVHYEDIEQNGETVIFTQVKALEERVVQALRGMKVDQAAEALRDYLNAVLAKDSSAGERPVLFIQLISRIVQLMQEQGASAGRVLVGERELEKFLRLQTREEITEWFESQLFLPAVNLLSEKADAQYGNIAERMVRMIHEQYDRDITLESCASAMNFHPVYVSRVFKKEMGVTFSEYLSEYRMNMGKLMLEMTTLKISEIGERLQYKNISAFIRTFRKTFGQTPGKYRETLD